MLCMGNCDAPIILVQPKQVGDVGMDRHSGSSLRAPCVYSEEGISELSLTAHSQRQHVWHAAMA